MRSTTLSSFFIALTAVYIFAETCLTQSKLVETCRKLKNLLSNKRTTPTRVLEQISSQDKILVQPKNISVYVDRCIYKIVLKYIWTHGFLSVSVLGIDIVMFRIKQLTPGQLTPDI